MSLCFSNFFILHPHYEYHFFFFFLISVKILFRGARLLVECFSIESLDGEEVYVEQLNCCLSEKYLSVI